MKKCKQGYYYCYKDKKCKRIPGGYRVGLGGYLRREKEEEKSEDSGETETKKNGNGNGNGGNGSNGGNGGGGVSEAVMSPAQKRKDTMLKKKYDDSDMKKNFIKHVVLLQLWVHFKQDILILNISVKSPKRFMKEKHY